MGRIIAFSRLLMVDGQKINILLISSEKAGIALTGTDKPC
jgi:hypothetical protein